MPTPRCYYECNLTVVKPDDSIRNTLMLGLDEFLIRLDHVEEDT